MQAVGNIRVPLDTREQLYTQLSEQGFSPGLQQWLGSNLVTVRSEATGNEAKLDWTFSLEGASAMYRQGPHRVQAASCWVRGQQAYADFLRLCRTAGACRHCALWGLVSKADRYRQDATCTPAHHMTCP